MIRKTGTVNPVAKTMLQRRRAAQVVPDKTKYNRKKDKDNANKIRKDEAFDTKG